MSEKLDKIADKLAEQSVHLARIDERLGTYNQQLEQHIKRTEIAEGRIDELYKYKYLALGITAAITFLAQLLAQKL